MSKSNGERALALQLEMIGIKDYETEYKFHDKRKWRFDFAWPQESVLLAVEVEGGIWSGGRHTRGVGFESDCEKYAEAILLGWTIFRVTSKHIVNGMALNWIERYLIRESEQD